MAADRRRLGRQADAHGQARIVLRCRMRDIQTMYGLAQLLRHQPRTARGGVGQYQRDLLAPEQSVEAKVLARIRAAAFGGKPNGTLQFDQALARISQSLTTLSCECPRHVVELLISLGTFERYSADCANRSPADAELHRWLQQVAGAARASFEDALVRVAAAEGLPLPDTSSPATT